MKQANKKPVPPQKRKTRKKQHSTQQTRNARTAKPFLLKMSLFKAYDNTLNLIRSGLSDVRFISPDEGDAQGRTPWAILAHLIEKGAKLEPGIVKPLGDEHLPPTELTARRLADFMERETADKAKFRPTLSGGGGRSVRSSQKDRELTHSIWQLDKTGQVDGGLLQHLREKRARLQAKLKAIMAAHDSMEGSGDGLSWDDADAEFLCTMSLLEEFMAAEEERLWQEESMEVRVWHFVAYFKSGAVSLHPDRRMNSPLARRAIIPLATSDGHSRDPRLRMFLARVLGRGARSSSRARARPSSCTLPDGKPMPFDPEGAKSTSAGAVARCSSPGGAPAATPSSPPGSTGALGSCGTGPGRSGPRRSGNGRPRAHWSLLGSRSRIARMLFSCLMSCSVY